MREKIPFLFFSVFSVQCNFAEPTKKMHFSRFIGDSSQATYVLKARLQYETSRHSQSARFVTYSKQDLSVQTYYAL